MKGVGGKQTENQKIFRFFALFVKREENKVIEIFFQ